MAPVCLPPTSPMNGLCSLDHDRVKEDPIKYEETDTEHRDIGVQTEIVGYIPTLSGLWESM